MKYINTYTVQRSGSHAVIFWLLSNFAKKDVKYINDTFVRDDDSSVVFFNFLNRKRNINIEQKIKQNTFLVMKGYENIAVPDGDENIVIIRDIVNILCSFYKKHEVLCMRYYKRIISVWKQHIRYANLNPKKSIIYNRWVLDKGYRDNVCFNFDTINYLDSIDTVPIFWSGSSFINLKKETDIQKYLERYKQVILPKPIVSTLLNDNEIIESCLNIFNINLYDIFKFSEH